MIIRAFEDRDKTEVKLIHETFFQGEFDLPDFNDRFLCSFVVEHNDLVVCVGGVRPIAEAIAVTNKYIDAKIRREALYQVLSASSFICKNYGYNQLHAFIQNKEWKRHLIKAGFTPCKGDALVIGVEG